MTKKIIFSIIAAVLVVGLFAVFSQKKSVPSTSSSGKIQVSASFYPMYFFTSQIGGKKADVTNITPAGVEPHAVEPSAQDIAGIEHGDMLVLNGGVEAWGEKIQETLRGKKVKVVIAGKGLLTKEIEEEGKKQLDPHVWLDPILAKKEVRAIAQGYVDVDPPNKTYYEKNEKMLDEKLDQLDTAYKNGLQNCKQRDIITSHAAFGYLAARYGLHQVPIAGLSPEAEPSSQQLAEIATFAKEHHVKYIFFESLVSPKLAETIANEVGAKTLVLDPIEGISDDDMKQGKNYFIVMEKNLKNLQIALECNQ